MTAEEVLQDLGDCGGGPAGSPLSRFQVFHRTWKLLMLSCCSLELLSCS